MDAPSSKTTRTANTGFCSGCVKQSTPGSLGVFCTIHEAKCHQHGNTEQWYQKRNGCYHCN